MLKLSSYKSVSNVLKVMKFPYAVTLWRMAIAPLGSHAEPGEAQPNHGLVGLRPLPRTAKMDRGNNRGESCGPKERKALPPEVSLKPPSKQSRPNVVLIFTDDMGYSDLPKFGKSEIPTPNIDRLAQEGTLFTDAYVTAPICVASRMGLMTGQYQQRFGIYCNMYGEARTRLFLKQTLLPAVFQDAGYRTAHVGKWHLSGNKRMQYETAGPRDRGFDESIAIRGGDSAFWKGTPVFRNGKQFPAPEYLTDLWGTEACAFIDRAHAQPFFLYLAYNAVHSPMHALDADQGKFPTVTDENRRIYDGMLLAMDRSIGRVLDRLDKHDIADNTIVVFMNDNGGGGSTRRYAGHSRNYANNKPLRGHKFDVLEGGVRVPLIIRWPKRAPAGKVYREMVSSTDVFPTLVAGAGLQMPLPAAFYAHFAHLSWQMRHLVEVRRTLACALRVSPWNWGVQEEAGGAAQTVEGAVLRANVVRPVALPFAGGAVLGALAAVGGGAELLHDVEQLDAVARGVLAALHLGVGVGVDHQQPVRELELLGLDDVGSMN